MGVTEIRTFVAVLLAPEVRSALLERSTRLARTLPTDAVRWSHEHQLHLTVRFLGQTSPAAVAEIGEAMAEAVSPLGRFAARLGDLGYFPNRRRPKVVWVDLRDSGGGLTVLRERLDAALLTRGWLPEARPFHPHLTLGRARGRLRIPDAAIWSDPLPTATLPVESIHLMQSILRPGGAEYAKLHKVDLEPIGP